MFQHNSSSYSHAGHRPLPNAPYVPRHLKAEHALPLYRRLVATSLATASSAALLKPSGRRSTALLLCGSLLVTGPVVGALGTAAGATTYHVVEEGETLSDIALRAGISTVQLAAINGLNNPDVIVIGQQLQLSSAASTPVADPPHDHVVRSGETLSQIAEDHKVSLATVREHNPELASRALWVGDVVTIVYGAGDPPAASTPTSTSTGSDQPQPVTPVARSTYAVQSGDTLSEIAASFQVTPASLASVNGMTETSTLLVGQLLDIPGATQLPWELLNSPNRLALMPIFDEMANAYNIPPDLLKALAWFESGWNNEVISSADAIGIGQILPITADFVGNDLLGKSLDPFVVRDNIELSAAYLQYLIRQTDGDLRLTVASYYQGLTAVRKHGIYASSEFYVDGILSLRERFA